MFIYCIFSNKSNLAYIGSTSLHWKTRIAHHISSFKRGSSTCSSVKVLQCPDYETKVLARLDEETTTIKALKNLENSFIIQYRDEGFNVVNVSVPGRTVKQYYQDNKEALITRMKDRYHSDNDFKNSIINASKARYRFLREANRLASIDCNIFTS